MTSYRRKGETEGRESVGREAKHRIEVERDKQRQTERWRERERQL